MIGVGVASSSAGGAGGGRGNGFGGGGGGKDLNTTYESTAFNQFSTRANERDAPNTVQEVL